MQNKEFIPMVENETSDSESKQKRYVEYLKRFNKITKESNNKIKGGIRL